MNSFLSASFRLVLAPAFILPLLAVLPGQSLNAAGYKIGVVDARAVLEESPQAERMAQALRREFEGRNRELIEMRQLITDLDVKLANDALKLTEQEKGNMERDRFRLSRDLARAEEVYKEDISFRRNEILTSLQEDIIEAIQAVSRENNFDIVLSEGVNWASGRVNMTPLVIEYMKTRPGAE